MTRSASCAEAGILVAGDRDQLRALLANRGRGREQFVGAAAVGNRDDDVARMHLAEAAVQRFGRVQKSRGRADRTEHAGGVARDVLGLADSGDVDAAAAAERRADYLDGARDGGDVQAAAQRGELGQCEVEEIFDFDGRVADSGLARLGVEARRRQRQRLGIEIEDFLAHVEARRKRAEARHRDRAGRIGEPSDLFPRQAETKARARCPRGTRRRRRWNRPA